MYHNFLSLTKYKIQTSDWVQEKQPEFNFYFIVGTQSIPLSHKRDVNSVDQTAEKFILLLISLL